MKKMILFVFIMNFLSVKSQENIYTTANAHSHNDYEQPAPFITAYNQMFGSIEADIFLQNDSLFVSHHRKDISSSRTLEKLYLSPLDSCIKVNKGFAYPDHKRSMQLLIDIKTEAITTLKKLMDILEKYPEIIKAHKLIISISGNRPPSNQFKEYPPYIWFDGILSSHYNTAELKKISMLSDYIGNYIYHPDVTSAEWDTVKNAVIKSHSLQKPVRFWATPDNQAFWEKMIENNVDFINTDHIDALSTFLKGDTIAKVGQMLPDWKKGYLDLHHINTGRGNVAYYLFPDSTNMLLDAGEQDTSEPRTMSLRNTIIHPNDSLLPFQWINHYLRKVSPFPDFHLDYAAITHFHEDHFGGWYNGAPKSERGDYVLSGITGVGELIPILHLLDRGYPSYDIPVPFDLWIEKMNARESKYYKTMTNYLAFVRSQKTNGFQISRFKAGSMSQIKLQNNPSGYSSFHVRIVKSNGDIWTGKDSSTFQHFPTIEIGNTKTWPDENSLSLAFTISYGPFKYYTGGDCAGNIFPGDAPWRDVETPVSHSIGEVDVATMDHHGNRDAVNENQIKTFKPSVWLEQVWSSDHPGHEVLIRVTSPFLYQLTRDIFATNMLEPNKLVIGTLVDQSYKSQQGHIVVRVLPGGNDYYVIILDDSSPSMLVKNIFGPYRSKPKNKF